jgi:hypothetical protein
MNSVRSYLHTEADGARILRTREIWYASPVRTYRVLRLVRQGATVLLLVALVLPLARCSGQRHGERADPGPGASGYTYYYAWSSFDPLSPGSWLILAIFAWPVALVLYQAVSRRPASVWLPSVQVLLFAGSLYVLYIRTFLYELWYGGYIAYTALSVCLLASVGELVLAVRTRLRSHLSPPGSTPR